MKDPAVDWERARTIIRSACLMLCATRQSAPVFVHDLDGLDADFSVLLRDATKMFCDALHELEGGEPTSRWSPGLPELLLAHPERCEETLSRVESAVVEDISAVHCASV